MGVLLIHNDLPAALLNSWSIYFLINMNIDESIDIFALLSDKLKHSCIFTAKKIERGGQIVPPPECLYNLSACIELNHH